MAARRQPEISLRRREQRHSPHVVFALFNIPEIVGRLMSNHFPDCLQGDRQAHRNLWRDTSSPIRDLGQVFRLTPMACATSVMLTPIGSSHSPLMISPGWGGLYIFINTSLHLPESVMLYRAVTVFQFLVVAATFSFRSKNWLESLVLP